MGKNLAEKILSQKAGIDAKSGDIVICGVDLVFVQDTTGPLTLRTFTDGGFKKLANPARTIIFIDHAAPSPSAPLSNDHIYLRNFARLYGATRRANPIIMAAGLIFANSSSCHAFV